MNLTEKDKREIKNLKRILFEIIKKQIEVHNEK